MRTWGSRGPRGILQEGTALGVKTLPAMSKPPRRAAPSPQAAKRKKEIGKRLGRPVLTDGNYEDVRQPLA